MKKSILINVVSILLTGLMVIILNTQVLAADSGNLTDLTDTLNASGSENNSSSNTNRSNTNSSNTNRTNTNLSSNNTNLSSSNTNRSNNVSTSIYTNNDSNLPQTGIEDSVPVAMLVVIFTISAIYAYKKIKDYRNL